MPSLRPAPPRSNPAERTAALQRKEDYSMSHHYSGPDFGFPQGDARLDFTDLYAFPKPRETGKSILIGTGDGGRVIVDRAPVSLGREAKVTEAGDTRFFAGWR